MITTIVTHHEIAIQDKPIYAQGWSLGAGQAQGTQAPRRFDGDDGIDDILKQEQEKLRGGGAAGSPEGESTGSSLTR